MATHTKPPKASTTFDLVGVLTGPDGAQRLTGTLEVEPVTPVPVITLEPATLPPMTAGRPVSVVVTAHGGTAPYAFTDPSGALPPGVTLAADGTVSGTPAAAGAYAVEMLATDAHGATGRHDYTGTVGDAILPASGTFTEADFEYLGALRLENDSAGLFQFAYGGIAGRKVNGKVRLFMAIDEVNWHGSILEFEVPDAAPSRDVATAPQMTRTRWWGDIYGGRRGTYMQVTAARQSVLALAALAAAERDPDRARQILGFLAHLKAWIQAHTKAGDEAWQWYEFPVGFSGIGCLYWDEPTKRLFWTYADFYNVAGRPDWGLGASTLHDDTPEGDAASFTADGPWRFACQTGDGWIAYGPWRGYGLIVRQGTDELVVCSTLMSGNSGSPWGPCGYGGGRLPAPGAPPMVDLVQPIRYLDHYPMLGKISADGQVAAGEPIRAFRRRSDLPLWEPTGSSALNINNELYGYDTWREVDGSGLVAWFDNLNGKSGVIYAGTCCGTNVPGIAQPGHECYANPGNNFACPGHGIPSPITVTGPMSTGNFSFLLSYKVPDLLRVAAGEIPDYSPEPPVFMNLQAKWHLAGALPSMMAGNNAFGGSYFDRDTRRLYMVSPKADNYTIPGIWAPFIQVFRVGGA